ncbi:MAG: SDR family NAD(P)-dependent oxidoreductase [Terriglobales bacterium]
MDSLTGKVAVITGASMGIGEALAKLFVDEGAAVVLSSRDAGRAEAARVRIGHPERTLALACDVRNREEIDRLMALTVHNFGRVDIWVNNAGFGLVDSLAEMDMAACRDMFATNLFGMIDGIQVAIPVMRQQGSGTIINVSSVAGHIPLPYSAAYSGTKFAMNAIGKAARVELADTGVHVMTVCPGYIATDFSKNSVKGAHAQKFNEGLIRGISAERVARAVLRGHLERKVEVVVPWRDRIFIKLYQLAPRLVEYGMMRIMRARQQSAQARGQTTTSR